MTETAGNERRIRTEGLLVDDLIPKFGERAVWELFAGLETFTSEKERATALVRRVDNLYAYRSELIPEAADDQHDSADDDSDIDDGNSYDEAYVPTVLRTPRPLTKTTREALSGELPLGDYAQKWVRQLADADLVSDLNMTTRHIPAIVAVTFDMMKPIDGRMKTDELKSALLHRLAGDNFQQIARAFDMHTPRTKKADGSNLYTRLETVLQKAVERYDERGIQHVHGRPGHVSDFVEALEYGRTKVLYDEVNLANSEAANHRVKTAGSLPDGSSHEDSNPQHEADETSKVNVYTMLMETPQAYLPPEHMKPVIRGTLMKTVQAKMFSPDEAKALEMRIYGVDIPEERVRDMNNALKRLANVAASHAPRIRETNSERAQRLDVMMRMLSLFARNRQPVQQIKQNILVASSRPGKNIYRGIKPEQTRIYLVAAIQRILQEDEHMGPRE